MYLPRVLKNRPLGEKRELLPEWAYAMRTMMFTRRELLLLLIRLTLGEIEFHSVGSKKHSYSMHHTEEEPESESWHSIDPAIIGPDVQS